MLYFAKRMVARAPLIQPAYIGFRSTHRDSGVWKIVCAIVVGLVIGAVLR